MMTIQRFAFLRPLSWALVTTACTPPLVENYEVLSVPVASTHYEAGRGWNTRIGSPDTVRNPDVICEVHHGLDKLNTVNASGLVARIEVPLIAWIGGALGVNRTETIRASFQGLKHTMVTDARSLTGTDAVLWETVTADSMTLTIDTTSNASLDVEASLIELKLANAGSVGLKVTKESTGRYAISSSKPLVVMVRVVGLHWVTSGGDTPFDLSSAGRNREQQAMLGYRVKPGEPFDPVVEKVNLKIHNDYFPRWPGESFTTSSGDGTWINPKREVIASSGDSNAEGARFVWDTMRVVWDQDLTCCKLHTVRQYVTLRNVSSGLSGTR